MRWFCSFKAYGDMVIACYILRKVDPEHNGLLAGSHLRSLLNVIDFNGTVSIIEIGNNVPTFFDTKKGGYANAIRSGFLLRNKIQSSIRQRGDSFVFDALGVRQRFLVWPRQVDTLGKACGNIYLDYARYLGLGDDYCTSFQDTCVIPAEKVYIFLDSRIKDKELPADLVYAIAKENNKRGKKTILVKVGTPVELPQFNLLKVKWVDGFDQLIAQIRKADIVVSADSLPAHLAEYIGIPVFVFTPTTNDYWMPLSSFKGGFYSGFKSLTRYRAWIDLN